VAELAWENARRRLRILESRLADGLTGDALRAPVGDDDRDAANYSGADAHLNRRLAHGAQSWSKSEHLARMVSSGIFAWCREVDMASQEEGDAERFIGLLKSQGDYQALRRAGLDDGDLGVETFALVARTRLGVKPRPWYFVYRARLGFAR
jgi:hypothetical protein